MAGLPKACASLSVLRTAHRSRLSFFSAFLPFPSRGRDGERRKSKQRRVLGEEDKNLTRTLAFCGPNPPARKKKAWCGRGLRTSASLRVRLSGARSGLSFAGKRGVVSFLGSFPVLSPPPSPSLLATRERDCPAVEKFGRKATVLKAAATPFPVRDGTHGGAHTHTNAHTHTHSSTKPCLPNPFFLSLFPALFVRSLILSSLLFLSLFGPLFPLRRSMLHVGGHSQKDETTEPHRCPCTRVLADKVVGRQAPENQNGGHAQNPRTQTTIRSSS